MPAALFFFPQDFFDNFGSFVIPYNFRIICSNSVKKMSWII